MHGEASRFWDGAQIRRAILDKKAVIPLGVRIGFAEVNRELYHVSGTGITVVPAPPVGFTNVPAVDKWRDLRETPHHLRTRGNAQ